MLGGQVVSPSFVASSGAGTPASGLALIEGGSKPITLFTISAKGDRTAGLGAGDRSTATWGMNGAKHSRTSGLEDGFTPLPAVGVRMLLGTSDIFGLSK